MYKIINNDTPNYLTERLPNTVGDTVLIISEKVRAP